MLEENDHKFTEYLKYECLDNDGESNEVNLRKYDTKISSSASSKFKRRPGILDAKAAKRSTSSKLCKIEIEIKKKKIFIPLMVLFLILLMVSTTRYFILSKRVTESFTISKTIGVCSKLYFHFLSINNVVTTLYTWSDKNLPTVKSTTLLDYYQASKKDLLDNYMPLLRSISQMKISGKENYIAPRLKTSMKDILQYTTPDGSSFKNDDIAIAGMMDDSTLFFVEEYLNFCDKLIQDRAVSNSSDSRGAILKNDQLSSLIAYSVYNKVGLPGAIYNYLTYPGWSYLTSYTSNIQSTTSTINVITTISILLTMVYLFVMVSVRRLYKDQIMLHNMIKCIPLEMIESNGMLKSALKRANLINSFSYFS